MLTKVKTKLGGLLFGAPSMYVRRTRWRISVWGTCW